MAKCEMSKLFPALLFVKARKGGGSFHSIDEGRESLDPNFEPITAFDWTNAAWRAGEYDVAGHQRHIRGDEANQIVAIENQLPGIRVLAQLTVLEKLDGEIVRIDLRLHIRSKGCKCVERFSTRP